MPASWLVELRVEPMDDGGMGSLRVVGPQPAAKACHQVSEIQFKDADGVDVIASLNVDDSGVPCEIDVWKVDFSALICLPESF